MPFAEHDDVRLYYEQSGDGDAQLVFVHGWCCDHSFWAPQLAHFSKSCRVTTFDLRGCGESSQPKGGYDIPSLASDVAWLCEALEIERPVVVGHSLGGMIGVELAAHRPSLPRAVIGVDPGPLAYLPTTAAAYAELADSFAGVDGRNVQRDYVSEMPGPGASDELARQIVETMCGVPLPIAIAVLRGVVDWDGGAAVARCIDTPMLVIRAYVSETDEPARLRALKPDIEYGVTVGAGHFNHLEAPEQVNGMIERFLAYFVP